MILNFCEEKEGSKSCTRNRKRGTDSTETETYKGIPSTSGDGGKFVYIPEDYHQRYYQ